MEYVSQTNKPAVARERTPEALGGLRAVLSFLVFGSMGALIGRWFSSYNDNHARQLVKPFGMIAGGLIGGIVAAYGSMRASANEAERAMPSAQKLPPVQEPAALPSARMKHDEAMTKVQAQSVARDDATIIEKAPHQIS